MSVAQPGNADCGPAKPHLGPLGLRQLRQARRQQLPVHALLEVVAAGLNEREVQLAGGLRSGCMPREGVSSARQQLLVG